jgi:hypothetical protein
MKFFSNLFKKNKAHPDFVERYREFYCREYFDRCPGIKNDPAVFYVIRLSSVKLKNSYYVIGIFPFEEYPEKIIVPRGYQYYQVQVIKTTLWEAHKIVQRTTAENEKINVLSTDKYWPGRTLCFTEKPYVVDPTE